MTDVSRETPPVPDEARGVFGERLELATTYADFLADQGTVRGLIGPREVPRLWERHIMNCAVVASEIKSNARVADIGSGAGLPGVVLAIVRPDLEVTLIEPLLRRVNFLGECVELLGLTNVEVVRGRAEEFKPRESFDVVTSRAVADLSKLAGWSMPLVRPGGLFLPMKGDSASEELRAADKVLRRLGGVSSEIRKIATSSTYPQVTLVAVRKAPKSD